LPHFGARPERAPATGAAPLTPPKSLLPERHPATVLKELCEKRRWPQPTYAATPPQLELGAAVSGSGATRYACVCVLERGGGGPGPGPAALPPLSATSGAHATKAVAKREAAARLLATLEGAEALPEAIN